MAQETSDPLLGAIVLGLAMASVATWLALADRLRRGPLLAFEPRRPVPWHGIWTLLPLLYVLLTVVAAIRGEVPEPAAGSDAPPAVETDVERLALGSAQEVAFVAAFLTVVVYASGATRVDLGLPNSMRELLGDARIGIVTWLAALAPVYGTQLALMTLWGPTEGHPIIKMIEEQGSPTLFALAFAAAVVVAPVCEELMFRLLLQGWFEKWEDFRLGWRTPIEAIDAMAVADSNGTVVESAIPLEPPLTGLAGLPYGWLPILLSSLLFALAHVGYGPDPIPLFLLALMLGYVYQRTHRIVPTIVAHALFNSTSLVALWRVMSAGGH